jgi:hypothetical protein
MLDLGESSKKIVGKKVDHVVNFIIPPLADGETGSAKIDTLDNGKYKITFTDIEGTEHSIGVDKVPVLIQDAVGNVYNVELKEKSDKSDKEVSISSVSASAMVIKAIPCYISYAVTISDQEMYFCNSQNVERQDEIFAALKTKRGFNDDHAKIDCNIIVKDSVLIDWYYAEKADNLTRTKPTSAKFVIRLNGKELGDKKYVNISQLEEGDNLCELIMKNPNVVVAQYNLRQYSDTPLSTLRMQVERTLPLKIRRKDLYENDFTAGNGYDIPFFEKDSTVILKICNFSPPDTTVINNSDTKWFVDNVLRETDSLFRHRIPENSHTVLAILSNGDSIKVEFRVRPSVPIAGRIKLDTHFVSGQDTTISKTLFASALISCNTGELANFIQTTPKEIVVSTVRNPAVNNVLHRGEATDVVTIVKEPYDALSLKNIVKDSDNAIDSTTILISKLTDINKSNIEQSIIDGKPTQQTEILLSRIARESPNTSDTLRKKISLRNSIPTTLLDTLTYKITDADDISEWITFHITPTIDISINLQGQTTPTVTQAEFTQLMAHELLHHWWTHFKKFEKLKWRIIRDKQSEFGYGLSDGLVGASTSPADSNRGCSMEKGHERHNPEHVKVCGDQNKY